jgi:hypothetical protein
MTISPSKDCWSRYDIDANFRVLAEWLGPGLPKSSDLFLSLSGSVARRNRFQIMAWLTRVNRGGGQLNFPPPID